MSDYPIDNYEGDILLPIKNSFYNYLIIHSISLRFGNPYSSSIGSGAFISIREIVW
jgi:hypothetical protein